MGLLNRVFSHQWRWLNTSFGWGLILTSVLFGAVHEISLTQDWSPRFSSQKFLMTGGLGFLLGFVKEKGQSLVPAIFFHNLWNLIAYRGR